MLTSTKRNYYRAAAQKATKPTMAGITVSVTIITGRDATAAMLQLTNDPDSGTHGVGNTWVPGTVSLRCLNSTTLPATPGD